MQTNIKNRLKKLESEVVGDSIFCLCNGEAQKVETRQKSTDYDAYATGKYVPYQISNEAKQFDLETENEQPTPEICQGCGKPVNKRLIILNMVG